MRTPLEFEQAHQDFLQLYNTTAHQGLMEEQFAPPIPLDVLGEAKGRLHTPDELERKFARALFPRTTNRYGCVTFTATTSMWKRACRKPRCCCGSMAMPCGRCSTPWSLAEYHCHYDLRDRHVTDIREGGFCPPALPRTKAPCCRSLRTNPWSCSPEALLRLARRPVPTQQLWLFERMMAEKRVHDVCPPASDYRCVLHTEKLHDSSTSATYIGVTVVAMRGFCPGKSSQLKVPLVARMSWRGLTAYSRPGTRPPGAENAMILVRLLSNLRRHWPHTHILVRGDSHFATPEVIDVITAYRWTDFVFGLAGMPFCSAKRPPPSRRRAVSITNGSHWLTPMAKRRRPVAVSITSLSTPPGPGHTPGGSSSRRKSCRRTIPPLCGDLPEAPPPRCSTKTRIAPAGIAKMRSKP